MEKLKDELEKQKSVLTPEAYREKESSYQVKFRDYQRQVQDANEELAKKEQAITSKIIPDIIKVVEKVGKDGKYDAILDLNNPVIVYHDNAARVNEGYPGLDDLAVHQAVVDADQGYFHTRTPVAIGSGPADLFVEDFAGDVDVLDAVIPDEMGKILEVHLLPAVTELQEHGEVHAGYNLDLALLHEGKGHVGRGTAEEVCQDQDTLSLIQLPDSGADFLFDVFKPFGLIDGDMEDTLHGAFDQLRRLDQLVAQVAVGRNQYAYHLPSLLSPVLRQRDIIIYFH
jgi:hypothetical protein